MSKKLDIESLPGFWFLNVGKDDSPALLEKIKKRSINSLILQKVYTNDTRKYFYLENAKDLTRYSVTNENLHEIVLGSQPRRFGCDIDMPIELLKEVYTAVNYDGSIDEFVDDIMFQVEEAIKNTAADLSSGTIYPTLTKLSRCRVEKYSYHLILTSHYLESYLHATEFHNQVLISVNKEYHPFIDPMTKSVQGFAIPYNFSKGHVLTLENPSSNVYDDILHNLLTYYDEYYTSCIDQIVDVKLPNKKATNITDVVIKECVNLYKATCDDANNHMYRDCKNGIMNFSRVRKSLCTICDRVHTTDNTLRLIYNNGSVYWFCQKSDISNKQFVGCIEGDEDESNSDDELDGIVLESEDFDFKMETPSDVEDVVVDIPKPNLLKDFAKKRLDQSIKKPVVNLSLTSMVKDLNINIITYKHTSMKPIESDDDIVCLKGEKGVGKTKAVIEYLQIHKPKTVGYISFRRSLASNIKQRFASADLNFKLYLDVVGKIKTDKWICQLESIMRIEFAKLDVLILDEFNALLDQVFAPTVVDHKEVYNRFKNFFLHAKKIIILDADIDDKTLNNIARLNKNNRSITIYNNTYTVPYNVSITTDSAVIIDKMVSYIKAGKKICITSNKSAAYLVGIKKHLENAMKIPIPRGSKNVEAIKLKNDSVSSRIMLYTSATIRKPEVSSTLDDVAVSWCKYDVVIYSPTIQSGVSFEEKHFDAVFGLFCNTTNSYLDCSQMLHRVRNCPQFYVYLNIVNFGSLPIGKSGVERWFESNRAALAIPFDESIKFINDKPSVKYSYPLKDDIYYCYLDLITFRNQSKMQFMTRFIEREKKGGAIFKILTDINIEDKKNINTQFEIAKEDAKVTIATDSVNDSEQVTYWSNVYGLDPNELDVEFFMIYANAKVREGWFNIKAIDIGAESLRIKEYEKHKTLVSKLGDRTDVVVRYNYQKHAIAMKIINLCGFDDIYDTGSFVKLESFETDVIPELTAYLKKNMTDICLAFGKKAPKNNLSKCSIKILLQWTNPILLSMYGVSLASESKDKVIVGYGLRHQLIGKLFQNSTRNIIIEKKNIPDISYQEKILEELDSEEISNSMIEFMS